MQAALALHRKGSISDAATIYREIIARHPDNATALHLLGVAELQSGNPSTAVELIRRAIALEPRNAGWHSNLGLALSQSGRLEEALKNLDYALKLAPNSPDTLNHRGNVLRSLGCPNDALLAYARALAIDPRQTDALNNRGAAFVDLNRMDEALASFDRALAANPNHAGALANRGALNVRLKRFDAALGDLNRAIALSAHDVAALNSRGNALSGLKRYDEALADFDRAIAADPVYADAWFNRATVLEQLRRFEEASASCDRTLALDPNHADTLVLRGQVLRQLDRPSDALHSYDRALQIDPVNANALISRAHLFGDLGQLDRALAGYEAVLSADPDHELLSGWRTFCKLRMCNWRGMAGEIAALEGAIDLGNPACSPAVLLAISDKADLLLQCAQTYTRRYFPEIPQQAAISRYRPNGKIRLGYFSADFHEHATAHLTAGFFELHDRTRFETSAFSFGPVKQDAVRARLQRAFDRFIDVRELTDADISHTARDIGIDIAIDMKGFTEGSRTAIFARRAAPIQVSWLGYPGTMGADYIDYIFADPTVLPELMASSFCEKIVWLPDCYQPNDAARPIAAATLSRKQFGLPQAGFVFCCFNNNYKITPALFDVWMRLLHQVQGSVLWLFRDNAFAAKNLRAEVEVRGVDPQRLVFADRLPQPEHLARHVLADLFLDTLPYNAHTTASDALWAGLPVLTCPGEAFQGRVAASLLCAAGLPELIAPSLDTYEAMALELAHNPQRLQILRQKLHAQRNSCPLFDTARYTRNFEAALAAIWRRHCRSLPPESFHVRSHPV
jgi:predicted O-linked N-acetylglucosamine transferase (SPINDLY family)